MNDINVLENLETVGVSLVKRGANKKKFAFSKSEEQMDSETVEILKTILEEMPSEKESKVEELFKESLPEEVRSALKGAFRLLDSYKDSLPEDLKMKISDLLSDKKEESEKESKEESEEEDYKEDDKKNSYGEGMEKKEETVKKEDILESVPEELKAKIESLWKSNEEAIKKAEALEAVLKAETDKRITSEFIKKSKEEFSSIPFESEKLGVLLKSVHEFSENLGKELESLLKSSNELIEKGDAFKEFGTSQSTSSSSVSDEVAAKAKQLVEKSDNTLSFSQAYDKILSSDPSLYLRYLNDNPKQVQ